METLKALPGVTVSLAGNAASAREAAKAGDMHMAVVDHELPDGAPRDFVAELMTINAMINTAMASPMSDEEFHEWSEGLGVLHRLPLAPGAEDAKAVVEKLQSLGL